MYFINNVYKAGLRSIQNRWFSYMASLQWLGVFVEVENEATLLPHQLDVSGFSTDAIAVRTVPDGIVIPTDTGVLLSKNRVLFATFLKEALEKGATMIALLYTSSGTTPRLITEAKKFAVRAAKFTGSQDFSNTTSLFVEGMQTAAQAAINQNISHEKIVEAFQEFRTLALFKKKVSDTLQDKLPYFESLVNAIDSLALPKDTPRREMLGLDRGNIANVYRNVFIGMIYLMAGDLSNAQLHNNYAYASAIWWAQLFDTPQKPQPTPQKKK